MSDTNKTAGQEQTIICFANQLELQGDGWAMLAPYGQFPGVATTVQPDKSIRRQRAVQLVTREAAAEMVNEFRSFGSRLKRFLRGVPIYVGHPDAIGIGDRFPRKEPIGTIAELDARETGLWCRPVFTNEGCDYLEGTHGLGFSARWTASDAGLIDNQPVFRPTKLLSAGLTDQPNLPVELLNEAEAAPGRTETAAQNPMDRTKLIGALRKLGVELANDASDEQIETALSTVGERLNASATLANEKTTLTTERDTARTELETARGTITTVTAERDTARTELANERTARIGLVLDTAVLSGRITHAERPKHEDALKADFANASEELGKLQPRIKVTSVLGDITARKAEIANDSPAGKFRALVKKHTAAGKSAAAAINAAIAEAPEVYAEFRNSGVPDLQL